MRKINIFALSAVLVACASSCELKDELTGDRNGASEMGALELAVKVQGEETRAEEAVPAAEDMYVEVVSTEDGAEPVYGGFYRDLENPMRIPVGTYTVKAHTEGEIAKEMDAPYYGGDDELVITKDITSQAEVTCKIMNTKVILNLGDGFGGTFSSWTVTLDNGKESVLTFTDGTAPKYWYLAEDQVTSLTLNFTGTLADGGAELTWQKSFTKTDADEVYDDVEDYFTGGEILDITLNVDGADVPEDNRPQISFDVDVELGFTDKDETVEIPVVDVTEPEQPGGDEDPEQPENPDMPTMIMPSDGHIIYTLNGNDQPASANVEIKAPKGLKSMNVKIVAGNDDFSETINDLPSMGLDFVNDGVEMVDNMIIGQVLSSFLGGAPVSAPATGDTEYTFPVGAFFGLMNGFGATAPNAHKFIISLEDQEGNTLEEELLVTINPAVE